MVLGGSQGDIQPFLYLADALVKRSHVVRVCTHPMFAKSVEATNAEFVSLATGDPRAIATDDYARRKRSRSEHFIQRFSPAEPSTEFLTLLETVCAGAGTLLCNTVAGYATHVGESLRIQTGIVYFAPFYPTRSFSVPVGPQNLKLGGTFNMFSHIALHEMYWWPNTPWINRWRKNRLGLASVSRWRHHSTQRLKRFFAFSPSLIPAPPDWPANNYVTGFWFGGPAQVDPPPGLASFLAAGSETIAVCFGSVLDHRVRAIAGQVIAAAKELGLRVVVVGGWGIENLEPSPDVCFCPFVPYSWLLPKVQIAVHAGGCGTTAEALRAGIPSVPIPFAGEQKFWAQRLWQSGAAHFPLDLGTLSKDVIKAALSQVRESANMRQKAREFGAMLKREDGLRRTIELIEMDL